MTVARYFSVHERNPGHWDVSSFEKRCFRIRGEPGRVVVIDERPDKPPYPPTREFRTVGAAMAWICDEFMTNEAAVSP